MRIDIYHHGDDALWTALGPYFCDRAVHRELGGPIYSTIGTTWLVGRDVSGQVIGFVSMRGNGKVTWLDYAYVVPASRGKGVFTCLSADRGRLAKDSKLPLRTVVRQIRWKHYRERGWKIESKRGSWIYAVKEVS
jgi:hypothetical protein